MKQNTGCLPQMADLGLTIHGRARTVSAKDGKPRSRSVSAIDRRSGAVSARDGKSAKVFATSSICRIRQF